MFDFRALLFAFKAAQLRCARGFRRHAFLGCEQCAADDFDQTLATEAKKKGVDIRFGRRVDAVRIEGERVFVEATDLEANAKESCVAKFVLDCSG